MSKIIGLGAAGNKAVIKAIEAGIPKTMCTLINSTLKDVDKDYHDITLNIGGSRGGCGKERNVSKELTIESFKDGTLDELDLVDNTDEIVFIVASTEGGTGSGSLPLIAKYYKERFNLRVCIIAFTGFEDDARGMLNTIEFFRDLDEEYNVQIISNKKFTEITRNRVKAQNLANEEFAERMRILLGYTISDAENNIDETDLFKTITTPGYMTVEYSELKSIKNLEDYNKTVSNLIDNTKSIDIENPSAVRMATILNIKENTEEYIDYEQSVLKKKLGMPYEAYSHIQNEEGSEYINVIASGMRLPLDEISNIYNRYKESMNKVNTDRDSFFDTLGDMGDISANKFNSAKRTSKINMSGESTDKLDFIQIIDKEDKVKKETFFDTISEDVDKKY